MCVRAYHDTGYHLMSCYHAITWDHIKQDLRYTQKPIYLAIFSWNIWSYLLRWSPAIKNTWQGWSSLGRTEQQRLVLLAAALELFLESFTRSSRNDPQPPRQSRRMKYTSHSRFFCWQQFFFLFFLTITFTFPALLHLEQLQQSRFGDKLLQFQVICPQNGTAVPMLPLDRAYIRCIPYHRGCDWYLVQLGQIMIYLSMYRYYRWPTDRSCTAVVISCRSEMFSESCIVVQIQPRTMPVQQQLVPL